MQIDRHNCPTPCLIFERQRERSYILEDKQSAIQWHHFHTRGRSYGVHEAPFKSRSKVFLWLFSQWGLKYQTTSQRTRPPPIRHPTHPKERRPFDPRPGIKQQPVQEAKQPHRNAWQLRQDKLTRFDRHAVCRPVASNEGKNRGAPERWNQ